MPYQATAQAGVAAAAYSDFLRRYPAYESTRQLDRLRDTEYRRLDEHGQVYLDYTGGSLYAVSQLERHMRMLRDGVLGNPHSGNPASAAMTEHVERTRRAILDYFRARDYFAIFTLNASSALKLVGESFPFAPGSGLLLTFDNHNSVNGIREFARARGANVEYAPLTMPDLRVDMAALDALLERAAPQRPNLFAFPAQSNFTGVKHSLKLIKRARQRGWRVLLDAAAFVPANRLDLSAVEPDFVALSFYKMFGYPTGVGALLAHRSALPLLSRPWFAGGTVNFVSVQARAHVLSKGEGGFEDGTLNYLSIPAVEIGLEHLQSIGLDIIGARIGCLTGWLLDELLALRHGNGHHMVRIYGPANTHERGGTITFNLYDPHGHLLDYRRLEELAGDQGISLRTGCFCNPGAGESAEGLTAEEMRAGAQLGEDASLQSFVRLMTSRGSHKGAGAIRASVGIASNFNDIWRLLQFVSGFRDQSRLAVGEVTFDIESCRVIRDGS